MDRVDLLIGLVKEEIENGMEHRVFAEIAKVIAEYDILEHLQQLEDETTISDVAEACIEYIDNVKDRLKREVVRDDLAAKYLGVNLAEGREE